MLKPALIWSRVVCGWEKLSVRSGQLLIFCDPMVLWVFGKRSWFVVGVQKLTRAGRWFFFFSSCCWKLSGRSCWIHNMVWWWWIVSGVQERTWRRAGRWWKEIATIVVGWLGRCIACVWDAWRSGRRKRNGWNIGCRGNLSIFDAAVFRAIKWLKDNTSILIICCCKKVIQKIKIHTLSSAQWRLQIVHQAVSMIVK